MANKIKPARGVKSRVELVKGNLEPYELIISTDTEQLGYKKSNNEVAYMANEKNVQEKLVSGANIKTVGMQSLLGSGNISIPSTDEFASKAELAPYISSKNLAVPDLKDKEYLGDGEYRLYNVNGIIIDYNVYSGVWTVNGQPISSSITPALFNVIPEQQYIYTYTYVSGSITDRFSLLLQSPIDAATIIYSTNYENQHIKIANATTQNSFHLYTPNTNIFNNFQFKLQLEKGTEATPFAVPAGVIPYIPEVRTANKWFLVATNSVAGSDIISIPNNLNELLIIANDHSTVHLPNISQASGLSVRTLGSGVVNTGANWRTTTSTIVKGWPDGTTAKNTEYKIYGR